MFFIRAEVLEGGGGGGDGTTGIYKGSEVGSGVGRLI